MSSLKNRLFANSSRRHSPRLTLLSEITKISSDSPSNSPENTDSSSIKIKSEPFDCEESTSSFMSKEKDHSDDEWAPQDISLMNLRKKCKSKKRRKNSELDNSSKPKEEKHESDLDEPLIVLKVKRSRVSSSKKNKNEGMNVISPCVDNPMLQTGQSQENPRVFEETVPVQSYIIDTSSLNDGTDPDTRTSGDLDTRTSDDLDTRTSDDLDTRTSDSMYLVKTEPFDLPIEISYDLTNSSSLSSMVNSEVLEERDQIEFSPSKVDFIAKYDSSPEKPSYLIWLANQNVPSGETEIISHNVPSGETELDNSSKPKEEKHESDLDGPLIVLKVKRSRVSSSKKNKNEGMNVISPCVDNPMLQTGQSQENPRVFEETVPVQSYIIDTSSLNDGTDPDTRTSGDLDTRTSDDLDTRTSDDLDTRTSDSMYLVKTEPFDLPIEISYDLTNSSSLSSMVNSEVLEERDQIEFSPSKVDFIAKYDSSPEKPSYLIWLANQNVPSGETEIISHNVPSGETELDNSSKPKEEKHESDLDGPLIVLKVKRSRVSSSKKNKNEGMNVISPCVDNPMLQTGQSQENPRVFEETVPVQSYIIDTSSLNDGTDPDTRTSGDLDTRTSDDLDTRTSDDLDTRTSDDLDTRTSDSMYIVKTEPFDLPIEISYDLTNSSNLSSMVNSEVLEERDQIEFSPSKVDFIAKYDSSPEKPSYLIWLANQNVPSGETEIISHNESCTGYLDSEEHFDSPEIAQKKSHESEIIEGEKSTDIINENFKIDCVNLMDCGFLCEEAPDFLDISNFGSRDGQLESIVYNAISTSSSVHNSKKNDIEGTNQINTENVLQMQSDGVLQFCNNLEKEQCTSPEPIDENGGAELEKVENEEINREEPVPIKLLSNRNIISPTSQEKLCNALTGFNMNEGAEFSKYKKKILFENWTKTKKPASGSSPQRSARSFLKPRGIIAKKPIGNSSPVQMDMQKAIEFSQRQMQDFENIASKLLKSMKLMKTVMDESLTVDSPPLSKFSFNKIKAASDNASELDRMTKKWLNIMSKDCNRFCKILKCADDHKASPSSENSNNKRRRIVFADEAGGVLCHIRLFNDTETSIPANQTEKPEQ